VMEHIERAGVHSGDSTAVYPAINLSAFEVDTIVDYTTRIGLAMQVRGLMNVQYVMFEGGVYVLEVNPRASRTVPFLSKVTTVPMVQLATLIMTGKKLSEMGYSGGLWPRQKLVAVKAPVFSMAKLVGVDTYLGPEMKSTGEVMGIDRTYPQALNKALIAAGMALRPEGALLLSIADHDKLQALPLVRDLHELGYTFFATEGTAVILQAVGLPVRMIPKKVDQGSPNVVDVIRTAQVIGVVNTVTGDRTPLKDGFLIRRTAAENGVPCFTSLDTLAAAIRVAKESGSSYSVERMSEYIVPPTQTRSEV
jgi:carbamoyl-phosphate synthase large subunit